MQKIKKKDDDDDNLIQALSPQNCEIILAPPSLIISDAKWITNVRF